MAKLAAILGGFMKARLWIHRDPDYTLITIGAKYWGLKRGHKTSLEGEWLPGSCGLHVYLEKKASEYQFVRYLTKLDLILYGLEDEA